MTTPPAPAMTAQEALRADAARAAHETERREWIAIHHEDDWAAIRTGGSIREPMPGDDWRPFSSQDQAEDYIDQRAWRAALSDAERRATEVRDDTRRSLQFAESRLSAVEARCGLMREALEFYANEDSWSDEGSVYDDYISAAKRDRGARARSILAYPGGKSEEPTPEHAKQNAAKKTERRLGFKNGIRAAVTWLHVHAGEMNDPNARSIINGCAFGLGNEFRKSDEGENADPLEAVQGTPEDFGRRFWDKQPSAAPLSRSGDSALVEAPGKQIGYAVASRGQIFVETVSPHRRAAIVNWLVTRRGVFVANNWTDGEIEIAWQQHRSSSDEAIAVAIFPLAEIDKFIQQHGAKP